MDLYKLQFILSEQKSMDESLWVSTYKNEIVDYLNFTKEILLKERSNALDELTALSQQYGLYDKIDIQI